MRSYLEIESIFQSLPSAQVNKRYKSEHYVKGKGDCSLHFFNLTVPQIRNLVNEHIDLSGLNEKKQWDLWHAVWKHSSHFEPMLASLHFTYQYFSKKINLSDQDQDFQQFIKFTKRLDNWAHSDELSKCYALLYERYPTLMGPVLEQWSESILPWERRQSLVALLYYSRLRKSWPTFPVLKKFIKRQLKEPHYYIQKGVGWTIRETYNIYPEETLNLLHEIVHELSPHAWQAATEKLSFDKKKELKAKRIK